MKKNIDSASALPVHIGIIMDGNGRWAQKRGLPRTAGHTVGAEVFRKTAEYCKRIGVKHLTVYAFSTENWRRSKDEVDAIMRLFKKYLEEALEKLTVNDIRIKIIGDTSALSETLQELIKRVEAQNTESEFVCNIAVNYGGRDELLHAVKAIAEKVEAGELKAQDITLNDIDGNLYTAGQPDPDLIIRPSGEYRLSNFLIWQAAYSEFWFSDILWPDFTADDLDKAIIDYSKRNRRFGGV